MLFTIVNDLIFLDFIGFATCLSEEVVSTDVVLTPNPSTGIFYIEGEGIQKYEVMDAKGLQIKSMKATQGTQYTIDLSPYSSGIYYLRVWTKTNKVMIKKLIKL